MRKVPKVQTGRNAASIEAGQRVLGAAKSPRLVRDVAKAAELARLWTKEQGYALDLQITWGKRRFDALRKLGQTPQMFKGRKPVPEENRFTTATRIASCTGKILAKFPFCAKPNLLASTLVVEFLG